MDLQGHAVALIGVICPLLTQLVKRHFIQFSGKSAQIVSVAIAGLAVAGASFALHQPLGLNELFQNGAMAFALSQLVYAQVEGTAVQGILTPGR
jgi:hypothetical protein